MEKYGCVFVQRRALRSEARNYGAKVAHGEFYFFVDSDMELFPSVIQECVKEMMKSQGVKALIGAEWATGRGFWASCKALERELNIGYEVVEAPRFFAKDVFWKVGGYDPELEAGEDWDLFQRVKKVGKVSCKDCDGRNIIDNKRKNNLRHPSRGRDQKNKKVF